MLNLVMLTVVLVMVGRIVVASLGCSGASGRCRLQVAIAVTRVLLIRPQHVGCSLGARVDAFRCVGRSQLVEALLRLQTIGAVGVHNRRLLVQAVVGERMVLYLVVVKVVLVMFVLVLVVMMKLLVIGVRRFLVMVLEQVVVEAFLVGRRRD